MINARCSRAPRPLYRGKPAPVIFTPVSKSIKSYFLASSQWGRSFSCFWGMLSTILTISLSASDFPLATEAWGILGRRSKMSVNSLLTSVRRLFNPAIADFRSAVSWRAFSAASFCPDCISLPISLAMIFILACLASASCCKDLRWLSRAMIFSTDSRASKFFTARRSMTVSLFSWINFRFNII